METEMMPVCDGRDCGNQSVGKVHKRKPRWRWANERTVEFDLVAPSHYCPEHERAAKDYLSPSG